jgi:hypothetical protein
MNLQKIKTSAKRTQKSFKVTALQLCHYLVNSKITVLLFATNRILLRLRFYIAGFLGMRAVVMFQDHSRPLMDNLQRIPYFPRATAGTSSLVAVYRVQDIYVVQH